MQPGWKDPDGGIEGLIEYFFSVEQPRCKDAHLELMGESGFLKTDL